MLSSTEKYTIRTIEGGVNYALQAFRILNENPEFPGLFDVVRPGKDQIALVHRKCLWITPNIQSI